MTTTENQKLADSEMISFLEAETGRVNAQAKRSLVLGVLVFVMLLGYFGWLLRFVSTELLDSETLATITVGVVEDNINSYVKNIEAEVKNQAPHVAKDSVEQIKAVFPAFRLMIQSEFEDSSKLIPVLKSESQDAVRGFVRENASEIKALFEAHKEGEFAERALDATFKQLVSDLDKSGLNIREFNVSSLRLLTQLRDQMAVLAAKSPSEMTEMELKKARLIVGVLKGISEQGPLALN